jgi:hypothetical protein
MQKFNPLEGDSAYTDAHLQLFDRQSSFGYSATVTSFIKKAAAHLSTNF